MNWPDSCLQWTHSFEGIVIHTHIHAHAHVHINPQKVLQICPWKYGHTEEVAPGLYKMVHCVRAGFLEEVMRGILLEVLVLCLSLRVFSCLQLHSPPGPTTLVF